MLERDAGGKPRTFFLIPLLGAPAMKSGSMKTIALAAHRWAGLLLAPLFLLIIISGGILALKPVVEDPRFASAPPAVETSALVSALKNADPRGQVRQMSLSQDGRAMILSSQAATGPEGAFSIATGEAVAGMSSSIDIFGIAKSFHKDLLLGAGLIILVATYIMLGIILAGPFLGWLRFRNTIAGWHLAAGWVALPIIILAPLTGILMSLHLGSGAMPSIRQSSPPLALWRGVEAVAQEPAVDSITFARRFKMGSVLVDAKTAGGSVTYLVDGTQKAVALEDGPGLVKSLHEGIWAGAWSGLLNLLISIILTGLTVTGMWSWVRRWRQTHRRSGSADADILVAHASQTGTAGQLAEATFRALEGGGTKVACMSLSGVRPDDLQRYRHVSIIASTTGEGDLAEPGRAFLKALQGISGLKASFSILALGDRRYKHFCAGGEMMRSAMLAAGAEEAIPMVRADGAPHSAWRDWLAQVEDKLGISAGEVDAPPTDVPVSLELRQRSRLDNPGAGDTSETWQVVFAVAGNATFRPGDLLMLSPGGGEPERCYSIGNSGLLEQGRIVLTVSRNIWTDETGTERYGQMSNLLCRELPVDRRLTGSIRRHPHFNPPEDPSTPIIMVATGCGVAPFIGFIEERSSVSGKAGPAWLMFGNRYRKGDFLYRETLVEWQEQGALTQLSIAFSRDSDDGRYITDKIVAQGSAIIALLRDKGGILYVCGRTRLGEGVETALVQALVAKDNLSDQEAETTVRKWKATGSLRQDLFD